MSAGGAVPAPPLDLRTLLLAAAVWVGAAAGWVAGFRVVLAGLFVVGAAVGWRRLPSHRTSIATLGSVVACVAALVATFGAAAREPPPDLIDRTVAIEAVITGPSRQVAVDLPRPPQRALPARLTSLRLGQRSWDVDVPARLLVPGDAAAPPGAIVATHAVLGSRRPRDAAVPVRIVAPLTVIGDETGPRWIGRHLQQSLSVAVGDSDPPAAALVAGIALGDESGQTPELAAAMRTSGLSHLTAVSGGNFAVVVLSVVLVLRLGRASLPQQVAAAALAAFGYAMAVGAQPSVVRAGAMTAAALLATLLGGPVRGWPVLFGCVALLLLASPELAWSLGFALSVAATAGLQALVAPLTGQGRRWWPRCPSAVLLAVAVPVVAALATAPLLVVAGAPASWVTIPANLVVAPLITAITLAGLAAAVLGVGADWPGVGWCLAELSQAAAWVAVQLAARVVTVAEVAQQVATSGTVGVLGQLLRAALVATLAAAVLVTGWVWLLRRPLGIGIQVVVAALAAALCLAALRTATVRDWRLIVCDVGQGTAVLVRGAAGPNAPVILFDTGPARGDVVGCLAAAGVSDLTAVVISHPHADHIGGLPQVLATRAASALLVSQSVEATAPAAAVRAGATARGVPVVPVAAGQRFGWGDLTLTVLWPGVRAPAGTDDLNNASVVVLVQWADGFSALLPGDIEPEAQTAIQRSVSPLGVDVLVIPHHGSDSQDPAFAAWAAPRLAIASTGTGNSYGHPATETLAEYQSTGAAVWRTDTDGAAVVQAPTPVDNLVTSPLQQAH